MLKLTDPIKIIGLELRTTNDKGQSFKDIPPFWQHFMQENYIEKIPNKLDNNIYGVYTNFENIGINNEGMYSLIIGCQVSANTKPIYNFKTVTIPTGNYLVFPVEKGRPDKVGETWQTIWSIPEGKKRIWRFECEFEKYHASGEIEICIGLMN